MGNPKPNERIVSVGRTITPSHKLYMIVEDDKGNTRMIYPDPPTLRQRISFWWEFSLLRDIFRAITRSKRDRA